MACKTKQEKEVTIIKSGCGPLPERAFFEGQEYRFLPGRREVEMYIRPPHTGINQNTGFLLVSHNWGGTIEMCSVWCDILCDKFNLICIDTNYLQSGPYDFTTAPYDTGVLQAMDCLRALYWVRQLLIDAHISCNIRRTYATGASGGGNISQMVNKLAPHTFACIIDLCGVPGLTEEVAFGKGTLNAGYSASPDDPRFLTPAMKEIRDFGNPEHLKIQYEANPKNQVVIVHGQDDDSCNCADKVQIFSNMIRAGFRPEGHFLTDADIDGIIIQNTGHSIGDRPYVIATFGNKYLAERGDLVKQLNAPDDFERKSIVEYPVTGGMYRINYTGVPSIAFVPQRHETRCR